MSFVTELKRRKVIRATITYVVVAWLVIRYPELKGNVVWLLGVAGLLMVVAWWCCRQLEDPEPIV